MNELTDLVEFGTPRGKAEDQRNKPIQLRPVVERDGDGYLSFYFRDKNGNRYEVDDHLHQFTVHRDAAGEKTTVVFETGPKE